jgi:hypothetical protein
LDSRGHPIYDISYGVVINGIDTHSSSSSSSSSTSTFPALVGRNVGDVILNKYGQEVLDAYGYPLYDAGFGNILLDSKGYPIVDAFGLPVYDGGLGNPFLDSRGNPIYDISYGVVINGKDTYSSSSSTSTFPALVGRNVGDVILNKYGQEVLDAYGSPIYDAGFGNVLLDSKGFPIVDAYGYPVYDGGLGNPFLDSRGHPIYDISYGVVINGIDTHSSSSSSSVFPALVGRNVGDAILNKYG